MVYSRKRKRTYGRFRRRRRRRAIPRRMPMRRIRFRRPRRRYRGKRVWRNKNRQRYGVKGAKYKQYCIPNNAYCKMNSSTYDGFRVQLDHIGQIDKKIYALPTSSGFGAYLQPNSAFQPYGSISGLQHPGYDIYEAIYKGFLVTYAKISSKIYVPHNLTQAMWICARVQIDASASVDECLSGNVDNDIERWLNYPLLKWRFIPACDRQIGALDNGDAVGYSARRERACTFNFNLNMRKLYDNLWGKDKSLARDFEHNMAGKTALVGNSVPAVSVTIRYYIAFENVQKDPEAQYEFDYHVTMQQYIKFTDAGQNMLKNDNTTTLAIMENDDD